MSQQEVAHVVAEAVRLDARRVELGYFAPMSDCEYYTVGRRGALALTMRGARFFQGLIACHHLPFSVGALAKLSDVALLNVALAAKRVKDCRRGADIPVADRNWARSFAGADLGGMLKDMTQALACAEAGENVVPLPRKEQAAKTAA